MTVELPEIELHTGEGFPAGLMYTAYAAYAATREPAPKVGRTAARDQVLETLALAVADGVAIRGAYETGGYRASADVLLWLAGPTADSLQDQLIALRRPLRALGLDPYWSAIGVHREAEFNKGHVPAYYAGEPARRYVCVYPFARRSGTCCRRSAAGSCSPSTAHSAAPFRTFAPTRRAPSVWAITSGCLPSRLTRSAASST